MKILPWLTYKSNPTKRNAPMVSQLSRAEIHEILKYENTKMLLQNSTSTPEYTVKKTTDPYKWPYGSSPDYFKGADKEFTKYL